jgi:hypothetical protein
VTAQRLLTLVVQMVGTVCILVHTIGIVHESLEPSVVNQAPLRDTPT